MPRSHGGAKLAPPRLSRLALMPSATRRRPRDMPERTRRSRGGGNLPPPRMSELSRIHLHRPAPCCRLCTPPVPVDVPPDVPRAALVGTSRVVDMAVNTANTCPPARGYCPQAEHGNRSALVRRHRSPAGPASPTHWPSPAGPRLSTHPCVDRAKRAHALRTPSSPHTRVCGGISAGPSRAPPTTRWCPAALATNVQPRVRRLHQALARQCPSGAISSGCSILRPGRYGAVTSSPSGAAQPPGVASFHPNRPSR